jgi:hypothetical protein
MGCDGGMKNEIIITATSVSRRNMTKKKALAYDLAEAWMLFWTFFIPIAMLINRYPQGKSLIYKGYLFIILIFAMTIIRRYMSGSFKYLLANFILILFTYLISFTFIEKVFFCLPLIICFFISLRKRIKEEINFFSILTLIWMEMLILVYYFIAFALSLTSMMNLINFASINVAISCLIYLFISRFSKLLEWEGKFIKDYVVILYKIRTACIAFISGIILFLLLLAWKGGLYKLLDMLTREIINLICRIGSFKASNNNNNKPLIKEQVIHKSKIVYKTYIIKNDILLAILNILTGILLVVGALISIYLIIKLFIGIWEFILELTNKKPKKTEKKESVFSLEELKSSINNKAQKFKHKIDLPFNMSNQMKIRRLYFKLVEGYKSKGLQDIISNTPVEIEANIKEIANKNINEATVIYEKARYSEGVCSKEEVDRMKGFIK